VKIQGEPKFLNLKRLAIIIKIGDGMKKKYLLSVLLTTILLTANPDGLSDKEKQNRLKLEEAKRNYGIAMENFQAVLDIKDLITNIHKNEDCYVAYYRIKDLNRKIKSSDTEDIKVSIYTEIKSPLQTFSSNCRNLRLEKYKK